MDPMTSPLHQNEQCEDESRQHHDHGEPVAEDHGPAKKQIARPVWRKVMAVLPQPIKDCTGLDGIVVAFFGGLAFAFRRQDGTLHIIGVMHPSLEKRRVSMPPV